MTRHKRISLHRTLGIVLLSGLFIVTPGLATPDFPVLSGRVVDAGGFLSAKAESQMTQKLEAHENASGNQVVVVTLPDLQGYSIEEFGYQLGRHWAIGQQDKDNGVLLIVARAERRIRIEVGYGLEGTLTDAISSNIVHQVIRPAFKKRQFEHGITEGVNAIIAALGGEYTPQQNRPKKDKDYSFLFIFMIIVMWPLLSALLPLGITGRGSRRSNSAGYYGGGFGGSGSFGGGGFSGGGGGFGGGGASGGW